MRRQAARTLGLTAKQAHANSRTHEGLECLNVHFTASDAVKIPERSRSKRSDPRRRSRPGMATRESNAEEYEHFRNKMFDSMHPSREAKLAITSIVCLSYTARMILGCYPASWTGPIATISGCLLYCNGLELANRGYVTLLTLKRTVHSLMHVLPLMHMLHILFMCMTECSDLDSCEVSAPQLTLALLIPILFTSFWGCLPWRDSLPFRLIHSSMVFAAFLLIWPINPHDQKLHSETLLVTVIIWAFTMHAGKSSHVSLRSFPYTHYYVQATEPRESPGSSIASSTQRPQPS